MFDLDAHLGVHADALRLRSQRAELIANNLANADTPDFKARDLDFRAAMANAGGGTGGALHLATSQGGSMGAGGADTASNASVDSALRYRTALAPSLDGNTVDVQIEQAAFAENAVHYQATLSFLNARFRSLMTALTGQ